MQITADTSKISGREGGQPKFNLQAHKFINIKVGATENPPLLSTKFRDPNNLYKIVAIKNNTPAHKPRPNIRNPALFRAKSLYVKSIAKLT